MYIYIYIYIYICIYIYIHTYIYTHTHIYIYIRSIAFMWHRLWPDCTYMWHVSDVWRTVYVGYVIIWGIYVTYLICSFVRVHIQLVVISHSTHMMCIFSFLCNARCICIWFMAIVFKIFFPSRSTTNMYSLTTISVHFLWNQVLLQVFNVSYQLLCIVSFIEADWHRYKLEWRQALSRTFMVIHR